MVVLLPSSLYVSDKYADSQVLAARLVEAGLDVLTLPSE